MNSSVNVIFIYEQSHFPIFMITHDGQTNCIYRSINCSLWSPHQSKWSSERDNSTMSVTAVAGCSSYYDRITIISAHMGENGGGGLTSYGCGGVEVGVDVGVGVGGCGCWLIFVSFMPEALCSGHHSVLFLPFLRNQKSTVANFCGLPNYTFC